MTELFKVLWAGLMIAVMIWYSTITIYVAVRGAFDIKHMLARLKGENEPPVS